MLKLFTSAEMRSCDRVAIDDLGVPGVVLMEHAGVAVARAAAELRSGDGPVAVVCGKGNNGGDGHVAARWLAHWGLPVRLFSTVAREELTGDARAHADLAARLGLTAMVGGELDLAGCSLVIDALLGTGVTGPPREPLASWIQTMNAAPAPRLAVDLPSGLDADTGRAYIPCVAANRTVTLAGWKRGLALTAGVRWAGEVTLADIGLPQAALDRVPLTAGLLGQQDVAAWLPRRELDLHKGRAGRVVVIGGRPGVGGAAVLAARAAARGGAGLVTLAVPAELAAMVEQATLETMTLALPTVDGEYSAAAVMALEPLLATAAAVAIGPGFGLGAGAARLLAEVLERATVPVVLDADALTLLAQQPALAQQTAAPLVLTPHPGEAARLLGRTIAALQDDRLAAVGDLAVKYGAVALLKGHRTVIATPEGQLRVNPTGTPAMASGGMGDVLTGLLAALCAQGLPPLEATCAAAWLHGRAAELAAGGADAGLLAGEVSDALPVARAELHQR